MEEEADASYYPPSIIETTIVRYTYIYIYTGNGEKVFSSFSLTDCIPFRFLSLSDPLVSSSTNYCYDNNNYYYYYYYYYHSFILLLLLSLLLLLLMLLITYVKLPIVIILEFYTETCNVTAVSRSNVQFQAQSTCWLKGRGGRVRGVASSGSGELFSSKRRRVTN